jgi:hypothetical protein
VHVINVPPFDASKADCRFHTSEAQHAQHVQAVAQHAPVGPDGAGAARSSLERLTRRWLQRMSPWSYVL